MQQLSGPRTAPGYLALTISDPPSVELVPQADRPVRPRVFIDRDVRVLDRACGTDTQLQVFGKVIPDNEFQIPAPVLAIHEEGRVEPVVTRVQRSQQSEYSPPRRNNPFTCKAKSDPETVAARVSALIVVATRQEGDTGCRFLVKFQVGTDADCKEIGIEDLQVG